MRERMSASRSSRAAPPVCGAARRILSTANARRHRACHAIAVREGPTSGPAGMEHRYPGGRTDARFRRAPRSHPMQFVEAIRLALATIRVQKLKSFFTLLGVTISVMFLIAVVSV